MKNLHKFTLSAVLLMALLPVTAQVNNPQSSNPVASHLQQSWLGVIPAPVTPALTAQLATLLPAEQGLMVRHVETDSPAAIAGIQPFDILLKLDDQKLYSPAQLSSLLHSIGPGKRVSLQLIHKAAIVELEVETGPRPVRRNNWPPSRFNSPYPWIPRLPQFSPGFNPAPNSSSAWDSFESVKVNTLGNGRYHAEVFYRNKDNESRSFIFEGKKEEIIRQIQQQKDLPTDKRDALLSALNMRTGPIQVPFNSSFWGNNPFNHPFFQRNIFDDPFFHSPFNNGYPSIQRPPAFERNRHPQFTQPEWLNRW